jgi:hypothetical protein
VLGATCVALALHLVLDVVLFDDQVHGIRP